MTYISSELLFIKLLTTSKVFFYFGMVKHQLRTIKKLVATKLGI